MYGFAITELAQVREQENMLERSRLQALRRARDAQAASGHLTRPRRTARRRLGALLAVGTRGPTPLRDGQPDGAAAPGCG